MTPRPALLLAAVLATPGLSACGGDEELTGPAGIEQTYAIPDDLCGRLDLAGRLSEAGVADAEADDDDVEADGAFCDATGQGVTVEVLVDLVEDADARDLAWTNRKQNTTPAGQFAFDGVTTESPEPGEWPGQAHARRYVLVRTGGELDQTLTSRATALRHENVVGLVRVYANSTDPTQEVVDRVDSVGREVEGSLLDALDGSSR